MSEKHLISIYRSSKREGMYVFVPRETDPATLPSTLITHFGQPVHAMDLVLTPERKLARASAADVIQAIRDQGFYLQMPPKEPGVTE
ncbi:YcgL domain-containing protein [Halomonadaceae bacterium KBTZ08]